MDTILEAHGLKIFSGSANLPLAEKIVQSLGISLGKAVVSRFSDGESQIELCENVRGVDVFVIQPTSRPANEHLMELLIMIDALKRASAGRITAVIPYYGYARQERKSQPRTPISAKLVADILTAAGADRILAVDLHAAQIQGFFDIPFDHLFATPVLLEYLKERLTGDVTIVSPDAGGTERARAFGKRLKAPLAIIDKRRPKPNVSEVMNIIGSVEGQMAVLVDDMVDTAGTLTKASESLIKAGAKSVFACCAHPILSGRAVELINASPIEELIVTDSIKLSEEAMMCKKIKALSIAPLLAEAIKRIHQSDSVSSLFV